MRLLLLLFFPVVMFAQEYEIKAAGQMSVVSSNIPEFKGTIQVTDSLVIMNVFAGTKMVRGDYDITHERNGAIYATDGYKEFQVLLWEEPIDFKVMSVINGKLKTSKKKINTSHRFVLKDMAAPIESQIMYYIVPLQE